MFISFANIVPYKTELIKSIKEHNFKIHKYNSNGFEKKTSIDVTGKMLLLYYLYNLFRTLNY